MILPKDISNLKQQMFILENNLQNIPKEQHDIEALHNVIIYLFISNFLYLLFLFIKTFLFRILKGNTAAYSEG